MNRTPSLCFCIYIHLAICTYTHTCVFMHTYIWYLPYVPSLKASVPECALDQERLSCLKRGLDGP